MNKLSLFSVAEYTEYINIHTDLKYEAIPCCFTLYVADPATLLASNSVLGTLFSSEFVLLPQ